MTRKQFKATGYLAIFLTALFPFVLIGMKVAELPRWSYWTAALLIMAGIFCCNMAQSEHIEKRQKELSQ